MIISPVAQVAALLDVRGPITMGPRSLHYALQVGIQEKIVQLIAAGTLTSIAATSVQVRKVPYAADFGIGRTHSLPAVLIFPGASETISPTAGTNDGDDVGYPVVIALLAGDDSPLAGHDQYLTWRETILRQFHHRRFSLSSPNVTFYDCLAEPGPVVDWTRWAADNHFVSVFTLRFFARLSRGTG